MSRWCSPSFTSSDRFLFVDEPFPPVKAEPEGAQRGGDGEAGGALRRRAGCQRHGPGEHDPELHGEVKSLHAGEGRQVQVPQQCAVLGCDGSD